MSDLVSRLAARAVGAARTTAGPRPIPLFSDEAGFAGDDRAIAWTPDIDATSGVLGTVGTAVHEPGQPDPSGIEPNPDVPQEPRRRGDRPAGSEPDAVTPSPADPHHGSPAAWQGPAAAATQDRPASMSGPDGTPPAAGGRPQPGDAIPEATAAEPQRAQPIPAAGPPPSPTPPRPQVQARPRPVSASTDRSDDSGEGAVVQVHIGRLDVRAAPEPAGPQRHRPEPPEPGISLADYLRGRREEP